jgi:hypothetical protein
MGVDCFCIGSRQLDFLAVLDWQPVEEFQETPGPNLGLA